MSRVLKKLFQEDDFKPIEKQAVELKLVSSVEPPVFKEKQDLKKQYFFTLAAACIVVAALGFYLKKPSAVAVAPVKAALGLTGDELLQREAFDFFKKQKLSEAQNRFERLLEKNPDSAVILNNLGIVNFKLKNYEQAKMYFLKAQESAEEKKQPQLVAVSLNNLASLSLSEKNYIVAIDGFKKAIKQNPNYIEARLNLGRAYEQAGKPIEAVQEYEAYAALQGGDLLLRKMIAKRVIKLKAITHYFEGMNEESEI